MAEICMVLGNIIEHYEKIAEDYKIAQTRFYSDKTDRSREAIYSQFDFPVRGKRILDAGCGFGKDMAYFKRLGASVYGIDASEKMIELAKKEMPELGDRLHIRDFNDTRFPDRFFDAVYSRYALHYSDNLEETFEEFARILKPKGHFIFLVAHPLLGFIAKKNRIYDKKEIVEIPLYDNACTVIEPTVTFSEYLNPMLLNNFDLVWYDDNSGKDNNTRETNLKEIVPDYMIMKLRKRN